MPPALPVFSERYEAHSLLGEGGAGIVVLATDTLRREQVAVKVVHSSLARHARFRARFAREVSLSARVVHPHIVPVLDQGSLPDGRPFVVLAYADQGSFEHLLEQAPPLHEALRVVDQVLDALASLHARGLLHQDLKPANVLLHKGEAERPSAWVADLGVAGDRTEIAMDRKGISGTPTWMAPEQLSGQAQELGPWTDLYPVGLMLYEMLGGTRANPSMGSKVRRPALAPLRPAPGVPASLQALVRDLTAEDPRQRYDRAADVRVLLAEAIEELEHGVRTSRVVPSTRRGTTTFPDTILPEGKAPLALGPASATAEGADVPTWNRVQPLEMPPGPQPNLIPALAHAASPQVKALREPSLFGREGLRRRLWALARRVVETGEPQVALIIGESGSGKSHLARAVSRELEAGGWTEQFTLRYHFPAGVEDGYRGAVREILSPWNETRFELTQRLQRWLARDQGLTLDRAANEAAVLTRWCGFVGDGEEPVNAAAGLAFLYRHLDARAWRGSATLVLEDVHLAQAQGDGLAICEALLERSVGERPILVLATLSSEAAARDPQLSAKIAALQRLGAVRLSAPRLADDQLEDLLVQSYGLEVGFALQVAAAAAGSPGYAVLAMRDCAARGLLVRGPMGGLTLDRAVRIEEALPASLEELCARRVQGVLDLSDQREAVSQALAAVALAGQEPPVPLLREVNQEGLDALLASGLVEQRGWRLVFEHSGVQKVARRHALARPDTAELHRSLAESWARVGKQTGLDVDLPHGLHRLHAGESARAVGALLRAARTALDEGRANLALDAGHLAMAAADRSGMAMARVEARLRMAQALLELDRPKEAEGVLEAARRGTHLDRRSRAHVDVLGARAAVAMGELDRGRKLLDRAATAFEATRDWAGLVDTAHGQGALFRLEGRPDDAAERFERMLRINRGKNAQREVMGLSGLIEARLSSGRYAGLSHHLSRLRALAGQSGDTRNIAQATYVGGLVQLHRRELEAADRHFQTARALAATLGADRLYLSCTNNLGEVARFGGRYRDARSAYEQAERFASERGWDAMAAVARINLAILALHDNNETLARSQVERAAALLEQHPRHWGWLFIGLMRALWAALAGDQRTCRGWWSVALERGLGRVHSRDLGLPLERLAQAAEAQGWSDIARRSASYSRHAQASGPGSGLEEEEEEHEDEPQDDGGEGALPDS